MSVCVAMCEGVYVGVCMWVSIVLVCESVLCECVCIACMCVVCVCTCMRLVVYQEASIFYLLRQCLSLALNSPSRLRWLARLPQGSACFHPFKHLGLQERAALCSTFWYQFRPLSLPGPKFLTEFPLPQLSLNMAACVRSLSLTPTEIWLLHLPLVSQSRCEEVSWIPARALTAMRAVNGGKWHCRGLSSRNNGAK